MLSSKELSELIEFEKQNPSIEILLQFGFAQVCFFVCSMLCELPPDVTVEDFLIDFDINKKQKRRKRLTPEQTIALMKGKL